MADEPIILTKRSDRPAEAPADPPVVESAPETIKPFVFLPPGESLLRFDFDQEVDAIRDFHERNVADQTKTWHNLLLYRNGDRILRLRCRDFYNDQQKASTFALAAFAVTGSGADEALWATETWQRKINKEDLVEGLDRYVVGGDVDDPAHGIYAEPSAAKDRDEALVAIGINASYWRARIMTFRSHDGAVSWLDDDNTCDSSNTSAAEAMTFESHLVTFVQSALGMGRHPEWQENVLWALTHMGFEAKTYE